MGPHHLQDHPHTVTDDNAGTHNYTIVTEKQNLHKLVAIPIPLVIPLDDQHEFSINSLYKCSSTIPIIYLDCVSDSFLGLESAARSFVGGLCLHLGEELPVFPISSGARRLHLSSWQDTNVFPWVFL